MIQHMGGSRRGTNGPDPPQPLENHKLLYVSLEVLVRTPLEKQLDPLKERVKFVSQVAEKR